MKKGDRARADRPAHLSGGTRSGDGKEGAGRGEACQRAARSRPLHQACRQQLHVGAAGRHGARSGGQDEAQVKQDQAQIDTARTQLELHDDHLADRRRAPASGRWIRATSCTRRTPPGWSCSPSCSRSRCCSRCRSRPCRRWQRRCSQGRGEGAGLCAGGRRRSRPACWIPARLSVLDNQVDPTTGTIKLKATFPESRATGCGRAASSACACRWTRRKDAVVVPPAAVQRGPRSTFVYVVERGQHGRRGAKSRSGTRTNRHSIITDGVKAGDKVVIDGASRLDRRPAR